MHSINKQLGTNMRRYIRLSALVLFLLSLFYLFTWMFEQAGILRILTSVRETETQEESITSTLTAPRSEPTRLRISSVGIDAYFEQPLGINEDGSVSVPHGYDTVGWYKHGPTPGEIGPTVILGHVDSVDGPAVFYSLGQASPGDSVLIERADGSTMYYTITGFERIEQKAFPTEKVYGNIPYAGLRLITCTGVYDKGVQRYSHNLIVYSTLTDIAYASSSDIHTP